MFFNQIILNTIITLSYILIIANSFHLIYQSSRFFSLTHAAIITLGAYFTYMLSVQLGWSLWLAIPAAVVLATCVGLLLELGIYKPLRKLNASPMNLMIASLGLYVVLQNVVSMVWGDDTKSIRTGEVTVGNEILGAYITDTQIAIIIISVILFVLILLFLKYTKKGKAIRAVSSNAELSNIFGINSDTIILWSVGIGSALASVAGILVSLDVDMTPTMGFNLLLYGVVVMIIGGVGSVTGLIGGAFLLATAQHLTAYYIDSKWMDAITYVILILFLIWKPLGFSGKRLKKVEL
ncbi:MAG: branched-chain amino acid ABC transporter permease [bacterium]